MGAAQQTRQWTRETGRAAGHRRAHLAERLGLLPGGYVDDLEVWMGDFHRTVITYSLREPTLAAGEDAQVIAGCENALDVLGFKGPQFSRGAGGAIMAHVALFLLGASDAHAGAGTVQIRRDVLDAHRDSFAVLVDPSL